MEPLSLLAAAVTTYILPKALEKVGEKMGEATLAKSSEIVQATRKIVKEKLQSTHTDGVLTLVESDPTETNVEVLKTVLLSQMRADPTFTSLLKELVNQIQAQSPVLQAVLEEVRIKGNVELGNIEQISAGSSSQQIVGRNLGVGGDFKVGDIIQEHHDK
jgi:hypothetical protein